MQPEHRLDVAGTVGAGRRDAGPEVRRPGPAARRPHDAFAVRREPGGEPFHLHDLAAAGRARAAVGQPQAAGRLADQPGAPGQPAQEGAVVAEQLRPQGDDRLASRAVLPRAHPFLPAQQHVSRVQPPDVAVLAADAQPRTPPGEHLEAVSQHVLRGGCRGDARFGQ